MPIVVSLSKAPLKATFTKIKAPPLLRSSHTLSVVGNKAFIFGGDITPSEQDGSQVADNAMHVFTLPSTALTEADYQSIPARPAQQGGDVPPARMAHTASVIDNSIFIFAGSTAGPDTKPLEENGRIWIFDTRFNTWSFLDPLPNTPQPQMRCDHASAATSHPRPASKPAADENASPNIPLPNAPQSPAPATETVEPPQEGEYGTIFIHAGKLCSGETTDDLWSFDLHSRTWAELPPAPGGPLILSSLTIVRDRLYKFGGLESRDMPRVYGHQIDFLDLNINDEFADKGGKGNMPVGPRGQWRSNLFPYDAEIDHSVDDKGREEGRRPEGRGACGFVPVSTGQGREYILLFGGLGNLATSEAAASGVILDDMWSFQLKPEGGTAGALKDATRGVLMGKDTGEGAVKEVQYFAGENSEKDVSGGDNVGTGGESEGRSVSIEEGGGRMIQEGQNRPMGGRGFFGVDALGEVGGHKSVLVHGGETHTHDRLGDMWVVSVE